MPTMMLRSWTRALGVAVLGVAVSGVVQAGAAAAAEGAPPTAADLSRLEGEIARLQQELRDQRQLVLQLMQMQEALLRYLNTGGTPPGMPPASPSAAAPPAGSASAKTAHAAAAPAAGAATAAITGHAHVGAGAPREAYVYLDGPRTVSSHPPSIEIRQADRQFVPAVAVVPTGAQILFPNRDTVFHNVFSNTPGDAFDVGTLKAGDTPKPVTMLKPGHVEIFCNIHSRMRADVLVVPNAHWTRVHPDGTFVLPAIPVGSRRIVVWGPGLKPVAQQVEVTAEGATVNLTTEAAPPTPHMNKQGAAYGSYENCPSRPPAPEAGPRAGGAGDRCRGRLAPPRRRGGAGRRRGGGRGRAGARRAGRGHRRRGPRAAGRRGGRRT